MTLDARTALVASGTRVYACPLDSFSATQLHEGSHFGLHLDLDGDTAVVGALDYNVAGLASAGAAWVFYRGDNGCVMGQKLMQTAGAAAGDRFGVAVGLSGDTLVVGADGDDEGTRLNAGSVTTYHLDLVAGWRVTGQYFHPEANAQHGRSVAIDGDRFVVGALGFSARSGQVMFWRKTGPNPWEWAQTTITPPEPLGEALFGFSVAISGQRALVGEPGRDALTAPNIRVNCGKVYAYQDPSGTGAWEVSRQISGRDAHERAGFAVAIDGDVAVAGCGGPPGWTVGGLNSRETGAAFVFDPDTSLPGAQVRYLSTAGLPVTAGAYFGSAVAVQGDVIAVGAAGDSVVPGLVRLFRSAPRQAWEIAGPDTASSSVLLNGHAESGNRFGGALAFNGNTLLVGGFATDDVWTDNGAVFLYQIYDLLAQPKLDISRNGNTVTLRWPIGTGLALWTSLTGVTGSWEKVPHSEARTSWEVPVSSQPTQFFRLGTP